ILGTVPKNDGAAEDGNEDGTVGRTRRCARVRRSPPSSSPPGLQRGGTATRLCSPPIPPDRGQSTPVHPTGRPHRRKRDVSIRPAVAGTSADRPTTRKPAAVPTRTKEVTSAVTGPHSSLSHARTDVRHVRGTTVITISSHHLAGPLRRRLTRRTATIRGPARRLPTPLLAGLHRPAVEGVLLVGRLLPVPAHRRGSAAGWPRAVTHPPGRTRRCAHPLCALWLAGPPPHPQTGTRPVRRRP